MTSTSSSVTVFSPMNDIDVEEPQAMNSTSSSVTVTSPINACRHKTDVETEEQIRSPDRRKSVHKKTYKKWLQIEIVGLSIIIINCISSVFPSNLFFYKNQVSDNAF